METSAISHSSKLPFMQRSFRKLVFRSLQTLQYGTLTIQDSEGAHTFKGSVNPDLIKAHIQVNDISTYKDMVLGGSVGAAEAYMTADWESANLTNVIRLMSLNLSSVNNMEAGFAKLTKPIKKLYHLSNKNTEKGSRRNIAAHYDLGNDLFELFLDPTMMYSSAIFPTAGASLEEGSTYKLDRICKKLNLQPTDHVVEIGTGWGGFAIHAAKHYGCKVTTTTLSQQQYDFAKARVEALRLDNKITLLMEDYRNLSGQYDKLVSIEMVEAVGHQFYGEYFETLGKLLKPEGAALIQAITIDHPRFKEAIKDVDFIQRYIFPGSCIPSIDALIHASSSKSDLLLTHMEDITPHYAQTLKMWRENFFANVESIRKLGYSEEFIRMWDYYFCYCEGGFAERVIGDVQLIFSKPMHRGAPVLGALQ